MQNLETRPEIQDQLDDPKMLTFSRDTLAFPKGLSDQPIATQTITFGSRSKDFPVLAEIDDGRDTFIVSPPQEGDPEDALWIRKIVRLDDGSAKNLENPRRISTNSDTVLSENQQGKLEIRPYGREDGVGLTSTTGLETRVTVGKKSHAKIDKTERVGSRASRITRKATGLLLAATVAVPAYAEVHDRLHNPSATKIVMETTEQLSIERATELARTMQDIENGNTDAVANRAEQYRKKNAEQLPSKNLVQHTREAIDASKTHDDVVQALQGFMGFYGKKVELLSKKDAESLTYKGLISPEPFDKNTNVDSTKSIAQSTVNALNFLPKNLLEQADFSRLAVSNACDVASGDIVVVGAESTAEEIAQAGVNTVTGNSSKEWAILHEVGHTFQHGIGYFEDITFTDRTEEAKGAIDEAAILGSHALKTVLRSPDAPSGYSQLSGKEKDAEIFAGLLSPNSKDWHGLHNPKDGTWFESKSNKYMLKKLVSIDNVAGLSTKGAYFSDWLMAQKLDLVEKY